MQHNQRIEKREPVGLDVALPGGKVGVTRDVSASGLFIEMDGNLKVGSVIDISIELSPNGKAMLFVVKGQIVRVEPRGKRTGVALTMLDSHLEYVE